MIKRFARPALGRFSDGEWHQGVRFGGTFVDAMRFHVAVWCGLLEVDMAGAARLTEKGRKLISA